MLSTLCLSIAMIATRSEGVHEAPCRVRSQALRSRPQSALQNPDRIAAPASPLLFRKKILRQGPHRARGNSP
jgi:hypothetical protein